jgi:hypothetical protein
MVHNNDNNNNNYNYYSNIFNNSNINSYNNNNQMFKNNSSSNQMNDQIESLQLDLNTIKDFLTNNSFNQIDPYTINNVKAFILLRFNLFSLISRYCLTLNLIF